MAKVMNPLPALELQQMPDMHVEPVMDIEKGGQTFRQLNMSSRNPEQDPFLEKSSTRSVHVMNGKTLCQQLQ